MGKSLVLTFRGGTSGVPTFGSSLVGCPTFGSGTVSLNGESFGSNGFGKDISNADREGWLYFLPVKRKTIASMTLIKINKKRWVKQPFYMTALNVNIITTYHSKNI